MRAAIIGCGLIGEKRAQSLRSIAGLELAVCCDTQKERAVSLAQKHPGCEPSSSWDEVVQREDIDILIVSTIHSVLPEVTTAAVRNGKHVLVEKPAARRAHELEPAIEAATKSGVRVRVGFNHRHHRALRKAREIVDSAALGPLLYIRARYGHGGRPGYDKEWRAVPEISGGGEAIDQGLHLIDLARWFLGDFSSVKGEIATYFWNMPVEDNAFFLLRTANGQVAQLHATWTEWKNTFSFEICGRDGKLDINGLGGSYGVERLAHYRMLPEMGPPETTIWEFPMADDSWTFEMNEFLTDIREGRDPSPGLPDAHAALKIVESVYDQK